MEERIQNLLTSLEAIKSNPALDTQEYQMKPEEKSNITVQLKAIQTDLLKAIDEFAVSFNIDLESSNITEQPQEPQEQPQEEPPVPPPPQVDEPPVQPPPQVDEPRPEAQLEPGTNEDMYTGEDFDDEEDEEDPQNDGLGGGNRKQTKKTKSKSKKTTQKNKKKN